jgi:hypothetical protein
MDLPIDRLQGSPAYNAGVKFHTDEFDGEDESSKKSRMCSA